MSERDWRNAEDYRFTETLNAGQWAWEFLRRNPGYRQDWQWFSSAWRRLESRYGKPPERDFQAWQRDPDAYRIVDDAAGECRIDNDKVLIECWMGARWGFYKFPLDPAVERPAIGEQLTWRELDTAVPLVEDADSPYLDGDSHRIALGFDLGRPLRPQLEAAKQFLLRRRARSRRDGQLRSLTVDACRPRWTLMLRLLDAVDAGEQPATAYAELASDDTDRIGASLLYEQAQALVRCGYRELAGFPGRS